MKLIQTQTLTSAQPTITFNDVPQNFTDLYVLISGRSNRAAIGNGLLARFNNDTNNVYSVRALRGDGAATISLTGATNAISRAELPAASSTANTFGNISFYIPNYTSAVNKSVSIDSVMENNATTVEMFITAGLWSNTAAITTITFLTDTANDFVAGSTISLYGIGGVGDGYAAPKATGGIISYADGYVVHTFTASGTFTPTANLTDVDYLVVAGGAGGASGATRAGGGGAGGYRSSVTGESSGGGASAEAKLSLASGTAYTVTIGAGGAGGASSSNQGANGSNSVFSTVTSVGGGGGGSDGSGNNQGLTGGSGGGSTGFGVTGTTAGGAGTANQGFAGGAGFTDSATYRSSGGGGGAGSVGVNGSNSTDAGANGGSGVSSSITGSSVARAGGGGSKSGGNGVDGGGNSAIGTGGAGTVNTGGGGGAGGTGGAGGSGIVIVRYAA